MKTRKLECENCKAVVPHKLILTVNFTTRYRTLTNKNYECTKCKKIKQVTNEKTVKNPQIWD